MSFTPHVTALCSLAFACRCLDVVPLHTRRELPPFEPGEGLQKANSEKVRAHGILEKRANKKTVVVHDLFGISKV